MLDKLYAIAQNEVGYDRFKDPENGTKYGRWYAEKTGNTYYGNNGVPYCAMFVSWCCEQAGINFPGIPSAYCPDIHKKQNVNVNDLQFMDLILFDWENDNEDDHIGFFVSWSGDKAYTIEGNTQNGKVCNRYRDRSTICGGVRSIGSIRGGSEDLVLPVINRGDKSGAAKTMQVLLLSHGYTLDKWGADGEYGGETYEALTCFQSDNELETDGVCGNLTWSKLLRL